jgi:cation diffusion facilitator family transporter
MDQSRLCIEIEGQEMDKLVNWMEEDPSPEKDAAVKRSTWISVAVNLLLTTTQVFAGIVSGSQGLLADGVHSLSDLVSDFVVLFATHHSSKDADEDHHYGHHRYENAASMVLGILLLVVGVGMISAAILKLKNPEAIPAVQSVALWVAVAALATKEGLFRYMMAVAQKVRSSLLVANAWHARSDAASSLVVGVGIVGNLMGLPLLDPIAALVVGVMIGKMGWTFAWNAIHALTDRAATQDETEKIRQEILGTPGVLGLHDLRTRKAGDLLLVDAHLEVDDNLSVRQGHDIALDARQRVMKEHAVLNMMTHVDPIAVSSPLTSPAI